MVLSMSFQGVRLVPIETICQLLNMFTLPKTNYNTHFFFQVLYSTGEVQNYLSSYSVCFTMVKPLPLIEYQFTPKDTLDYSRLSKYGHLILFVTWFLFIISVNSIFELWRYVILPLSSLLRDNLTIYFETLDSYVFKLWCIYIVCWWWALISWCGLEMFRNSKN